ncbi:MAG: hypothetical protein V1753_12025 [Pseudomonadota bacterium]
MFATKKDNLSGFTFTAPCIFLRIKAVLAVRKSLVTHGSELFVIGPDIFLKKDIVFFLAFSAGRKAFSGNGQTAVLIYLSRKVFSRRDAETRRISFLGVLCVSASLREIIPTTL